MDERVEKFETLGGLDESGTQIHFLGLGFRV
jgi:hypothetical protein